ncbi:MAG: hypothetical protein LBT31_02035 [Synergistaceae bacterium]|jgi:hypothetical protein|nr:hypothetical protein [Synergistaceae bacterium]
MKNISGQKSQNNRNRNGLKNTRKFLALIAALLAIAFFASASFANLSASGAFTLLRKIPPGEDVADAVKFLGVHATERTVDAKTGIKVRRWGTEKDKWVFDVLHDGLVVRAARITWITVSKRDQQMIFGQLTSEGRKFFGRGGEFHGKEEAEWRDIGEKWLVIAKMEKELSNGVTLLSGIRDARMDSGKYGF